MVLAWGLTLLLCDLILTNDISDGHVSKWGHVLRVGTAAYLLSRTNQSVVKGEPELDLHLLLVREGGGEWD